MSHCTLCDLPTPDPPVTDDGVAGVYCCRGCLEVARSLDDAAAADPERARESLRAADATAGNQVESEAEVEAAEGETTYFTVDGMHCATCEAFLESRARRTDGVLDAAASYASDALKVTYDPERCRPEGLSESLSGYGYRVAASDEEAEAAGLTTGTRLLLGGFFGMMVMVWYVLFLYPIYLGWDPVVSLFGPGEFGGPYLLWNVAVFSGAGTVIAGYPLFRGAVVSLRARQPNMDLLVTLAAVTAFGYSVVVLATGGVEVYFDIPVVVTLAVTAGDHWTARVKDRALAGVADRTAETVDTARVVDDDGVGTEERSVDDVAAGDRVVVSTGERVPLDGTVVDGDGAVDESLLTGESRPREVATGDDVAGGSVLVAGGLTVRVADDAESTLDRLVGVLWEVQATGGGTQRLADRLAALFVPVVLGLASLALVGYLLLGAPLRVAVLTALTVLVVSCPCALGLATPLAVSTGVESALSRGAVVTDSSVFERVADVDVVAFDKTGTLTTGEMTVVDVYEPTGGTDDASALETAAALEQYADHPVARAVCARADDGSALSAPVEDVQRHATGVSGTVDGRRVLVGRPALFEAEGWEVPDDIATRAEAGDREGYVPAVVGVDGEARAVALAGDRPRPEWEGVVEAVAADHRVVVLTGDEGAAADRFRAHEAVDEVFAGVPPEGKSAVVERLRSDGTVAMVGDGTNDAPALAAADIGVAMAGGARLAADAADVVVTADDLRAVPAAFETTAATHRRVRQNLGWAFCYNAVAVPLALVGALNPLLAAVAMATSSLLVVVNSARPVGPDADGTDRGDGQ